jgi:hypothetical protein
MIDAENLRADRDRVSPRQMWLIERQAVVDTVVRFGRALDDQDWGALRKCLAAELDTDYSSFRGTPPARITADAFIQSRRVGLAALVTQHITAGHLVDPDNDAAVCRCDFVIRRWPVDASDTRFFHSYGLYVYVVQRELDRWVIGGITQVVTRSEGDRSLHGALRRP